MIENEKFESLVKDPEKLQSFLEDMAADLSQVSDTLDLAFGLDPDKVHALIDTSSFALRYLVARIDQYLDPVMKYPIE